MIRRTLTWLGLEHLLPIFESDEIVRSIRHRSAHTTMQLTVIGCLVLSAVLRIWLPEQEQAIITLVLVALFMMITSSLINSYHGVDLAEDELRRREPVISRSTLRTFLSLFVLIYLAGACIDMLFDRATPGTMDLVG